MRNKFHVNKLMKNSLRFLNFVPSVIRRFEKAECHLIYRFFFTVSFKVVENAKIENERLNIVHQIYVTSLHMQDL